MTKSDVQPRKIDIVSLYSNIIKKILEAYYRVMLEVNCLICDNAMKHARLHRHNFLARLSYMNTSKNKREPMKYYKLIML